MCSPAQIGRSVAPNHRRRRLPTFIGDQIAYARRLLNRRERHRNIVEQREPRHFAAIEGGQIEETGEALGGLDKFSRKIWAG